MRRILIALPAALLVACGDGLSIPSDLSGTWMSSRVESSTEITLVQQGEVLTGSGTYWRFVNPPSGTVTVTGLYTRPEVSLFLRYDTGVVTRFSGVAVDPFHIAGVEIFPGGAADSLRFARR